ncbi:MAG: hypothetical protein R2818_12920 [Flavobacteriales bacterium]
MNGTWRLMIRDDESGDNGSIDGWSISSACPQPLPAWGPNVALSATSGASVTASPTSTQTYTVTVSHAANACTSSATVTVTTTTPPNAGTNGTLSVCAIGGAGDTFAQLTGSPATGGTWSSPSAVAGSAYDADSMDPACTPTR